MGKLTSLKPTLSTLSPTVAYLPDTQQAKAAFRSALNPWRKLYCTARWKRLRAATFLKDMYQCQMCKRAEHNTSKLVADHIKPHRGRLELFWDASNIWTLCASCHSSAKQRQEASGDLD